MQPRIVRLRLRMTTLILGVCESFQSRSFDSICRSGGSRRITVDLYRDTRLRDGRSRRNRSGRFANHERGLDRDLIARYGGVMNAVEQELGGNVSNFNHGLFDSSEPGHDIRSRRNVVEAHDGNVFGNAKAGIAQGT